ncbi:MAG: hypothetical protein WCD28_14075 [Nitrososphaeraceae archaeon]
MIFECNKLLAFKAGGAVASVALGPFRLYKVITTVCIMVFKVPFSGMQLPNGTVQYV